MYAAANRPLAGCAELAQTSASSAATAATYAVLRFTQPDVLTLLLHYHQAHEQCLGQRRYLLLQHFEAISWLKLALLHCEQNLRFTLEYDLRQYLKLPVAVGIAYFHDHIKL